MKGRKLAEDTEARTLIALECLAESNEIHSRLLESLTNIAEKLNARLTKLEEKQ